MNYRQLILLTVFIGQLSLPSEAQFWNTANSPTNVINNLLTPIFGPNSYVRAECHATADQRTGLCLPKAACVSSGGTVAGVCVFGMLSCCIYQGSCRSVIAANETYFVSPQYPVLHQERLDPPICIFTLQRNTIVTKWPICQIRLDFEEFTLAPPMNGTCGGLTDSFIVSGASNFNQSGLPETGLCGELTGQHLYLDVDPDRPEEPLLLIVNTGNEQRYNRKWSIRVQQIPCQSPFRAPAGCAQYFTTATGVVESLNFRGMSVTPSQIINPGYFNDLNYGVCVAKQPRMCGIRWEAGTVFDFGGSNPTRSGVGVPVNALGQLGCVNFGTVGLGTGDTGDYLVIPGASADGRMMLQNRFCGQRLNPRDGLSENAPLTTYMKPFTMIVHTDTVPAFPVMGLQNQRGFQVKYTQIGCQ